MDNFLVPRNRITTLLAEILRKITERYVMDELVIPGEVLALKDEACAIAEKAAREQNVDILGEYERRLAEILNEIQMI